MNIEIIARPPSVKNLRHEFEQLVTGLESAPEKRVRAMFGFAWANELYEGDWLVLELSGSELRERVQKAEEAELGQIGSDDFFIWLPDHEVEILYCHEGDIHLEAPESGRKYIESESQRWVALGWDVKSREVA